jgi:hypothetical protein
MPCLELLDIGYAAASRPGGVKDIVSLSRQLVDNRDLTILGRQRDGQNELFQINGSKDSSSYISIV